MNSQGNIFQIDESYKPLALRLRPKFFDELVGDIKNNFAFKQWFKNGIKQSAILWGPPGTGKTSIAELAAKQSKRDFIKLQAFNSGVKDLREIIERANRIPNSILLFVDEVHSFNKTQQDILLEALETGVLIFIGATTENPAISVNRALLSRTIKFELRPLNKDDLYKIIKKASEIESRNIEEEGINYLIQSSFGDARTLLNNLELVFNSYSSNEILNLENIQSTIEKKNFSADDNTYYDCISALQKSMRGSDPDAAIYWLARLLHSGIELEAIARRIVVTASEDVGLADPMALVLANAAHDAAIKLGMPEARIPLAQAVAYIAKAPKSNLSYKAFSKAMQDCQNHPPYPVPFHLRGINIGCPAKSDNEKINPITQYKYPHDYPGSHVEQQYMPDELKDRKYFNVITSEAS